MKKVFSLIVQFFVITASVMLGVYLGLTAFEYTQQIKAQVIENKTIAHIEEELKINAGRVSLSLDYHRQVKDTLTVLLKDKRSLSNKNLGFWKGIFPPLLHQETYRKAVATHHLDHLNSQWLEKIVAIYTLQSQLQGLSSPTTDYLLQQNLHEENRQQATETILQLITNYYQIETTLIALYNEVFQNIRKIKRSKKSGLIEIKP